MYNAKLSTAAMVPDYNRARQAAFKKIDETENRDLLLTQFCMGKMTYPEAAEAFGVTKGEVFDYVRSALQEYDQRDLMAADVPQLLGILRSLIGMLRQKTKNFLMYANMENYKPATAMIKELRGVIKDIADIEAKMAAGPKVEVEQLTIIINNLEDFLATDLCDDCRVKAAERLMGKTAKQVEASYEVGR